MQKSLKIASYFPSKSVTQVAFRLRTLQEKESSQREQQKTPNLSDLSSLNPHGLTESSKAYARESKEEINKLIDHNELLIFQFNEAISKKESLEAAISLKSKIFANIKIIQGKM